MLGNARYPRILTLAIGFAFIYFVAFVFHLAALFFMAAALMTAPLVSFWLAKAGLSRIHAERRVPARLWPDQRVSIEIRIRNEAFLPKCLLCIDEVLPAGLEGDPARPPSCVVPMLWSEPFVHSYPLTARRRGRHGFPPVTATAVDALDLYRALQVVGPPDEVVVYPRVVPLGQIDLHGNSVEERSRPRRAVPGGTDFRATREYRPGDDLRRMHWRSTARRGEPIVVEFEEPVRSDLFLVLDVSQGSDLGGPPESTLDIGTTVAASVITHELERESSVGLLLDGAEPVELPLTRERHALILFLEALAVVEADGPRPFAETVARASDRLELGIELMLVTAQTDLRLAGAVGDLLRRLRPVSCVVVDPPGVAESEILRFLTALREVGARVYRIRDGDVASGLTAPL